MHKVLVFLISLFAILLELVLTRVIGIKTWGHLVYIAIAFAMGGYGSGTILYSLYGRSLRAWVNQLILYSVIFIGASALFSVIVMPYISLNLADVTSGYSQGIWALALVCLITALPFIGIGFLISMIFARDPEHADSLYFWDLLGASIGAIVFYPLLSYFGPQKAIAFALLIPVAFSMVRFALAIDRKGLGVMILLSVLLVGVLVLPEPNYKVDKNMGFESVASYFKPTDFEVRETKWHPLGRTDFYIFLSPDVRNRLYSGGVHFTFEINLPSPPPFGYIATNFRAGTPVFNFQHGDLERAIPLSQPVEMPYSLLTEPRVLVIGTGGGRDIFIAKTNHAKEVAGVEVNPVTHAYMSRGGKAFDYSGGVYELPGVHVSVGDGRHFTKASPNGYFDLVILNGVDTFASLSSGAYAFAENFLYTTEAIEDYLRVLTPNGILNFNRWAFPDKPREELKLFAMALEALRAQGAKDPTQHIFAAVSSEWSITLIKKDPFTAEDLNKLVKFQNQKDIKISYSPFQNISTSQLNSDFVDYATAFREGRENEFQRSYLFDIHPATDDLPFFYKYYKVLATNGKNFFHPGGGSLAFFVQCILLLIAGIFIFVFMFFPLLAQRVGTGLITRQAAQVPFLIYFASLGLGFIIIEIVLMQKLTLFLGTPIYSITISLAGLLLASGIGSLLIKQWVHLLGNERRLIFFATAIQTAYVLFINMYIPRFYDSIAAEPFTFRCLATLIAIFPLGLTLGVFFPLGLRLVGSGRSDEFDGAIPWAWAINCGFTVLGSVLVTIIAQSWGFSSALHFASVIYLIAALSYAWLESKVSLRVEAVPSLDYQPLPKMKMVYGSLIVVLMVLTTSAILVVAAAKYYQISVLAGLLDR